MSYYVGVEVHKNVVSAYGIYDIVNGMVSEHEYFSVADYPSIEDARQAANRKCDEMNKAR